MAAKIPSHLEPLGLSQSDGKCTDGATVFPRSNVCCLVWDVTCPDMFTPSYAALIGGTVGTVADREKDFKKLKCQDIKLVTILYLLQLRLQVFWGAKARLFLLELRRCIKEDMGESNTYFISFRGYLWHCSGGMRCQ